MFFHEDTIDQAYLSFTQVLLPGIFFAIQHLFNVGGLSRYQNLVLTWEFWTDLCGRSFNQHGSLESCIDLELDLSLIFECLQANRGIFFFKSCFSPSTSAYGSTKTDE